MTAGDDERRIDDPSGAERDPSADDRTGAEEPTLAELRLRIQALAAPEGRFVVACARTGESPVPVDGYRFDSRAAAAEAAAYVVEYRARLRELDPRTPYYDPVVHEAGVETAVTLPDLHPVRHDDGEAERRSRDRSQ